MVAASADQRIAAGEIIDVREEAGGLGIGIYATRDGGEEKVEQLHHLDYVLSVTDELPGCLLVKAGFNSPRFLLAPLIGVQLPTETPAAPRESQTARSPAPSGSRATTAPPASTPSRSSTPHCQYPRCSQTDHLELCAMDGRRVACPVHRTLRDGSYVCKSCDEELAARAAESRAQSHHKLLLFGSVASIVLGVLVLVAATGNTGTYAFEHFVIFALVFVGLILVPGIGLYRTDAFRIGRMGQLDGLEIGAYWLTAIPAFLAFSVIVVILLVLGGFAKEEYSVAQDREWIRRRTTDL